MWKLSSAVALILFLIVSASGAVFLPMVTTSLAPDGKSSRHPRESLLVLVMSEKPPASRRACVEYGNTRGKQEGAEITITMEIRRDGEVAGTPVVFGGATERPPAEIGRNTRTYFLGCVSTGRLEQDDAVVFHVQFDNFRRLRKRDQVSLTAAIGGSVPGG